MICGITRIVIDPETGFSYGSDGMGVYAGAKLALDRRTQRYAAPLVAQLCDVLFNEIIDSDLTLFDHPVQLVNWIFLSAEIDSFSVLFVPLTADPCEQEFVSNEDRTRSIYAIIENCAEGDFYIDVIHSGPYGRHEDEIRE